MKPKITKQDFSFKKLRDFARQGTLAHLIIESSDDAIKSKTLDGTITSWNSGAEIMYGFMEEEMIGKNVNTLIPPNMQNELPTLMKMIGNGHHIPYYETKRIRKDGVVIDVTGHSRKKLIGTDFSNYFTEPRKAREGYQKVFKQGFVKDYPLTLKSKKGNRGTP